MASEIRLKPCPFCGGNAEVAHLVRPLGQPSDAAGWYSDLHMEHAWQVRCEGGDCPVMPETVYCNSPDEAAELWNRRAP